MRIATLEVFRRRYQAFCERFGRDPEPDEPLFFDPAQDKPVQPEPDVVRVQVMAAAAAARVDASIVLRLMQLDHDTRPHESAPVAPNSSHSGLPDQYGMAWLPIVPEEPSSKSRRPVLLEVSRSAKLSRKVLSGM